MTRLIRLGALLASLLLAGCSWWSDELEVKPAPLPEVSGEQELSKLWSARIGEGLGEKYTLLVPWVGPERVVAGDRHGRVVALERASGDRLWSQTLDIPVSGGVGGGAGLVLLASEKGEVVALNVKDGGERWRARVSSEVLRPPQSNGELVLVQTIDGRLTALSAETGDQRWVYSSQQPSLTLRGTGEPLLTANYSYAGFANGYLVAVNNTGGEQLWRRRIALGQGQTELERVVDLDGTLLLEDGVFFLTSYQGRVAAVAANNGQVLWSKELSSYLGLASDGQALYATDAEGHLHALERGSGANLWTQEGLYLRRPTAPAIIGDWVAVGDFEGYVHLLSREDGRFVTRFRVDGDGVRSQPVSRDGVLYVLGNGGRLTALTLD